DLALLARLLDDADEDILEREPGVAGARHLNALSGQLLEKRLARALVVHNHVKAVAKQRHAPVLHRLLETINGALRLIHDQLDQAAALLILDAGRRSLRNELARHHEP